MVLQLDVDWNGRGLLTSKCKSKGTQKVHDAGGKKTYIQRQGLARIIHLIPINSHQCFTLLEQTSLQTDDNKLEPRARVFSDIIGNLLYICIIQRGIHFIQNKEWRSLVWMNSKQQCESSHRLLTTREMFHVSESFHRWHGVIFDAIEIRFIVILNIEVGCTT